MAVWTFYDYIERTGRNPIAEWLKTLSDADRAKVDYRLQHMAGTTQWPEKWISKYRGTQDIYELRITGNRIQLRPLGSYFGPRKFILLRGAIEKGGKIPKSDIEAAEARLSKARNEAGHVQLHQFDDESDLEEDG
jgi:hypothetical protein